MKVYVASSWRNLQQPAVVQALRAAGHETYDFRNPPGGEWRATAPWWTSSDHRPRIFPEILGPLSAQRAFAVDMAALRSADAAVLVLPSGKSAHLEAGYAAGNGKPLIVVGSAEDEPELMYGMADKVCLIDEMVQRLAEFAVPSPAAQPYDTMDDAGKLVWRRD